MFKLIYSTILFLTLTISLHSDYINLIQADKCENIVEIFVDEGQIRVTFEIGALDYKWFRNIIPEKYYSDGYSQQDSLKRINEFFSRDFIINADGRQLYGEVTKLEKIKRIMRSSLYTGKVDTTSKASPYVIFVEIHYLLNRKPGCISITPPIPKGYDVTMANIGFVLYHKRIPVNDLRYLSAKEYVDLDWNDPWYSKFHNKNIKRHHDSSIMSFLYVDPYEVRHEILARIKDLDHWIDTDYKLGDYIEIKDQQELKNKVANFLITRNIVKLDGVKFNPIIDKVHFVTVAMSGIQIMQIPERLDYSSAIIGVIFVYPNPGMPKEVTVDWDMFTEKISKIPYTVTDPAGPMKYTLQPNDSVLVWRNYLKKYKLPTISEIQVTHASIAFPFISVFILFVLIMLIVKKGVQIKSWDKKIKIQVIFLIIMIIPTLPFNFDIAIPFMKKESFSNPEAKILIDQILKNTYRAFDFREESDIYDKLAVSSTGDLLADIYLQTKRGMVLENQGGIVVKLNSIDILDVEEVASNDNGLAYKCLWQVVGTVGHWGHIHKRVNQYNAVLNVKPVEGVWKLNALDIIEEKRL